MLQTMQDVYLLIADALARPLRVDTRRLYQLWRADFAALARLALTCREASMAVRRLLWHCTQLGERERARRAQVERAHAFMRLPSVDTLLVNASWTRSGSEHIWSCTTVAFNGRIRIREYFFRRESEKRRLKWHYGIEQKSPLHTCVGITFTDAEQRGRVLIWHCGAKRLPVWTGAFTDPYGALGGLQELTFLGREYWGYQYRPSGSDPFRRYPDAMAANLDFEAIVPPR